LHGDNKYDDDDDDRSTLLDVCLIKLNTQLSSLLS